MSKNILYSLITRKYEVIKAGAVRSGIKLIQKTHSKGTPYYFFDLPKDVEIVGDYTLDNHHMSVFAESNGYLDGKSQYHYTAYMKDKEGNSFRLHVYFNPQDGYVSVPLLCRVTSDGQYIPVAGRDDHHEAFKALAHFSIDKLIAQLRKDQKELVTKLKQEYEVLEKEATELSKNLELNKEAYKDNIDLQIAKLEELSTYTNTDPILANRVYLDKLKKSPELKTSSLRSGRLESKENKESKTTKISSVVETEVAASESDSRVVKKHSGLEKQIAELHKQFEQLKALKGEQLSEAITGIDIRLCALEIEGVLLKDLHELRAIRRQLDDKASSTLKSLLGLGKYTEATLLAPFYHLVPDTLIQLALQQNMGGLLNFLLVKKIIPADYNYFIIKDKHYTSLVDYYFKQSQSSQEAPKLAKMVACFDVLIKNGLSLMEIDSVTGLPFAAVLMLDPKHPLSAALKVNENITTNNPTFLKHLNQVLRVIAAQPACSQENKGKIKLLTLRNQQKIVSLQNANNPLMTISIDLMENEYTSQVKQILGLDLKEELDADPGILKARLDLEHCLAEVFSKMPTIRRDIVSNFGTDYRKVLDNLEAIKLLGTIPTINDFKKQIIQLHLCTHKDLDLLLESHECQRELSLIQNTLGNHKKRYSTLTTRVEKIGEEIVANKKVLDASLNALKKAARSASVKELSKTTLEQFEEVGPRLSSALDTFLETKKVSKEEDKADQLIAEVERTKDTLSNMRSVLSAFSEGNKEAGSVRDLIAARIKTIESMGKVVGAGDKRTQTPVKVDLNSNFFGGTVKSDASDTPPVSDFTL
jgi:predicted nucleotidyltransferase